MDYWLYLNDVPHAQLVDIARSAEACGFRGVAVADHIAVPVDFLVKASQIVVEQDIFRAN